MFPIIAQDHYGRFFRVESNGRVTGVPGNAEMGVGDPVYPLTAVLQNGQPTGLADRLATRVAQYMWDKGRW